MLPRCPHSIPTGTTRVRKARKQPTDDPDEAAIGIREAVEGFVGTGGLWWGNGFFHADATGDGKQRLVYVRHDAVGHHGDFQEVVWILKPGAVYRVVQQKVAGRDEPYSTVDPNIVDLRVDFSRDRYAQNLTYPVVGESRLVFPEFPQASSTARRMVQGYFMHTAQQPFLAHGRLYVLSGRVIVLGAMSYRALVHTPHVSCVRGFFAFTGTHISTCS